MKEKVLIIKIPETQLQQEVLDLYKLGDEKEIHLEKLTHQAVMNLIRRQEVKTEVIEEEIVNPIGGA